MAKIRVESGENVLELEIERDDIAMNFLSNVARLCDRGHGTVTEAAGFFAWRIAFNEKIKTERA